MISKNVFKALIILSLILLIPAFVYGFKGGDSKLRVYFFDVGQGDSILIKAPGGQNVLIDGGPDNRILQELPRALPFWDRTIDLMVLTHPHDDHVSGLVEVARRYDVGKAVSTGVLHSSPSYLEWLKAVRGEGIPLQIIDKPQKIGLGDGCDLEFIHPFASLYGKEEKNLNNTSIVSKLSCQGKNFLFTGDIEEEVEKKLLGLDDKIDSDVLKAAHHGSDTSNSDDFLKKVSPQKAVIQVGKSNRFGHPSGRVLKRFEKNGVSVSRTDKDGPVVIESDGSGITMKEAGSLVNFEIIDIIIKVTIKSLAYE